MASAVPTTRVPAPSSNANAVGLSLTEEHVKLTQKADRQLMKLIPIAWQGVVKKKGEWLPRWEEMYVTLDGLTVRVFESKAKYLELLAIEERNLTKARYPAGSPPSSRGSITGANASQRTASMSAIAAQKSLVVTASTEKPEKATATNSSKESRKGCYTIKAVAKENVGRAHGFSVATLEKKSMHFSVESEIERVVWIHLISAALEQQTILPKAKKRLVDQLPASTSGRLSVSIPHAPSRGLVPGVTIMKTLLGTPISVNLYMFYEAWGHIQCRKGNFADLIPSLHPNITITSNYPPSVPIAGEYHGCEGFLFFFTKLHSTIDISHYTVQHMARSGDLAVVTGRETIKNLASSRKFRHLWKHELRFEADGRISHINIIADKTAAAVAFGVQSDGPSLELPHEQEESASTCPPGEIRVVCISGEGIKKKKPIPASANIKVTIGLNNFPHLTMKAATSGSSKAVNHVGSWKSYSTRPSKNGNGSNPFWAETLSIQFSGAVPGTSSCLFIEVWSLSVMGDELIGCTKVNLANYLGTSAGTEEDIASLAVPKWYELRKPEEFVSSSGATGSPDKKKITSGSASGDSQDNCGRLQLSISFLPHIDDDDTFFNDGTEATPRHRKSFDRLQALHEETGEKERNTLDRRLSDTFYSENDSSYESGNAERSSSSNQTKRNSGSERMSMGSPDDMYTFTVASTKFRVYTRYQLIRAIGHGAYGVVIAASDQITGNSVAIKNIPKTFDDLVDAKRIVREIRLMRHLQHPNIVAVVDVMRPPSLTEFDDTYIVTDLMETDLHRVINSQETLSSDHIAYITYQLLCAIRYIHSAQIIHRDIKPSNILINRDCLVKICDFGLARGIEVASDGGEMIDQALTEYVVTRWYRAPELLLASRYTTAIDLWSIGCILVELFTRKALFPGHDHVHQLNLILQMVGSPPKDDMDFITNAKAKKWMARQADHEPKSFSKVCPSAPADAIDLMARLLEFDPRKRITVDEAIAHPFVASYRKAETESTAESAFDFSFEKENRSKLDKDTLRRLIFEDVCHFHPDAQDELDRFVREQERLRAVEEQTRQREESTSSSAPSSQRAGMA
ncbi:Cmgc/mapk protein kinase, partial [Globisporangium splendens]